MIVMKFGGTSLGDANRIKAVAQIVKSYLTKRPVVIVSAVSKITDSLIQLASESKLGKGNQNLESIKNRYFKILEKLGIDKTILKNDMTELSEYVNKIAYKKNMNAKTLDCLQSFGEQMSSKIVAAQLERLGVKACAFNSWDLGFLTNAEFGNAEPLEVTFTNLKNNIRKLDLVPVITGFIGKTEQGNITTLGRGGSDYTATIVGAALDTNEIQIWTDVDGITSADPKIVKEAKIVERLSFSEASELAYFGAKVLHPKTILPAMKKNIPVRVLNSFKPQNRGTLIVNRANRSKQIVKAIAYKKNIIIINVTSTRMLGAYGFLARLFEIFNDYKKSVDVISTSEVSVSMTIDNDKDINNIVGELQEIADVDVRKNKAIICAVGEGISNTPYIAGRIFAALGKHEINIEMISQGASKINITFVVESRAAEKAVKILHKEYCE